MSRFSGSQFRGATRALRQIKRAEAEVRASLARGLAQSAAGETVDLGDFTQYADDADEE